MNELANIAIIGKGNVGGSLGIRFTGAGYHVKFGIREGSDASELLKKCHGRAEAVSVPDAVQWANIIIIAIPAASVPETIENLGDVGGKVILDSTNPIRWEEGPIWNPPKEGSMAALIESRVQGAKVVKGFNTLGWEFMLDPTIDEKPVDIFLAGDDGAKFTLSEILGESGFRPIDAGPIRNAAVLENLAVLWIHLATSGGRDRSFVFKLLNRT